MENWYLLDNADDVDSPALLVYPARVQRNIATAIEMIGDVARLRPHIKTHKTKEVLQLQLAAGITKYKCATIAEAELLGETGAPDALLAYPVNGPKIHRLLALIERFPDTRYSAVVDNETSARALSEAAWANHQQLDTYIDLNIGMGRTGIRPGLAALALYRYCDASKGLAIRGFHAYDGHVREIDLEKRKQLCKANFEPVAQMIAQLQAEGLQKPTIIIGGSPSFPVYVQYPEVECSPGTFVFWDKGYGDSLPEQGFLPAALVLCRVVSLPAADRVCVDLGYKAIASESPLDRRVHFLDTPGLTPVSHSEEHLVLAAPAGHGYRVGDVLYALPIHICPTVALYDRLTVVQTGHATDYWPVTARKR